MLNKDISTFFQVVDADGSGGITISEMQEVQRRYLGVNVYSAAQVAALVAIIDTGDCDPEVLLFGTSLAVARVPMRDCA